jgi:phosphoinositide-3-kinase regulatory subunit 4
VTSWNWLYLTDFSSTFKPVYLPEDNPADYDYYFDTSRRRTCYLAPERFMTIDDASSQASVTPAMDIFSVGCVIAELFLETPLFNLSQHLAFRGGDTSRLQTQLQKIESEEIRELVEHMITIDPEARFSAEEYLNLWRRKAFPEYFYSFLHQYMWIITDSTSGRAPITGESVNLGEADERIERIYYDFDKISYLLGYSEVGMTRPNNTQVDDLLFPLAIDIPNNLHKASPDADIAADDGTVIFLNIIVASLRNSARTASRIRALDIILALSERLSDEAKLDRVLPYVMTLVNDENVFVKITAIRTVTQLLALVRRINPINAFVLPEFVLKHFKGFATHENSLVRATYAACLASLADTASRFLSLAQSMRAGGALPLANPTGDGGIDNDISPEALYEDSRNDILEIFQNSTTALVNDEDFAVRRAFLGSVTGLCVFFGEANANDLILSYLNTYLNENDWTLKVAFFEVIVGVATFVGGAVLEEFIVPVMVQALTDPEETVVEKDIRALTSIAELGLIQRSKSWDLIDVVARFTMHPNVWIRQASAAFLAATTTYLSPADLCCIVAPALKPFLKTPVAKYTELDILDALEKPLPRGVFNSAVSWSTRAKSTLFWKPMSQQRTFLFPFPCNGISSQTLAKMGKTDEDEQWLARLRETGMTKEDGVKLVALREYIQWTTFDKKKGAGVAETVQFQRVFQLSELSINPQTIVMDKSQESENEDDKAEPDRPLTIADALLDASMTIDENIAKRKQALNNGRRNPGLSISPAMQIRGREASRQSTLSTISPSQSVEDSSENQSGAEALPDITVTVPRSYVSSDDNSTAQSSLKDGKAALRSKPSAVQLLGRNDSSKALAETAMSSTNAFGRVETPFARSSAPSPLSLAVPLSKQRSTQRRSTNKHSYEGNDPNVLRVVDNVYVERFTGDAKEFEPVVHPILYRDPIRSNSGQPSDKPWRPEGVLVATLGEHMGPVNRVLVSPDHIFFITASDDSTVKVWDSARLERNVNHRSSQTHRHPPGSKVKSICFVDRTHCFVSAATDGTLHITKVNLHKDGGTIKYGKMSFLRNYQLPKDEYATWMEHVRSDNTSILLIATNMCRVLALNMRSMEVIYTLENPVHHGNVTCFCVDRYRNWILLGTSHGIIDLWDLRFRARLKAWGIKGGTAIHRIFIHPTKGKGKWACVAGGSSHGEITVWDFKDDKVLCREVYRTAGNATDKAYEAWKVDDERPEGMLGRFSAALEPTGSGTIGRGIRAFIFAADVREVQGEDRRRFFMITGGSDKKLRFWDLAQVEGSGLISGLEVDEPAPTYIAIASTTALTTIVERQSARPDAALDKNDRGGNSSPQSLAKKSGNAAARPPRSTVISLQQQQLLKTHLDVITDVAFLALPYGMTVSVDRSGMIYVFQ